MVIFGLNVGVTRAFAADEVYAIYKNYYWHSCDSYGGNVSSGSMAATNYKNITYGVIRFSVVRKQLYQSV